MSRWTTRPVNWGPPVVSGTLALLVNSRPNDALPLVIAPGVAGCCAIVPQPRHRCRGSVHPGPCTRGKRAAGDSVDTVAAEPQARLGNAPTTIAVMDLTHPAG